MMRHRIGLLGAIVILAVGFAAIASLAHAQYPSPTGGVSAQAGDTTTSPGDTTILSCSVVGPDGTPVPNVPCTFTITSQSGDDAAVGSLSVTKLTDSQGIATAELYVGTTPGVIVVEAESGGSVSSVLVMVEGETPSPPQAPIGEIQPPATGSGGLLGQRS